MKSEDARRRAIRAVLFDVGGPLNTEIEHERRVEAAMLEALQAEGFTAGPEALARGSDLAVASFAGNAYAAMIFELGGRDADAATRVSAGFRARMDANPPSFEMRHGIPDLLAWLHARKILIGLAANQPAEMLAILDGDGIGRYLSHRGVSGTHGYHKPDVRLFLAACDDLSVVPSECIMVGDRIDNDIVPARTLGMTTILFRTGRHIAQQPRTADEVPDAEIASADELLAALSRLIEL